MQAAAVGAYGLAPAPPSAPNPSPHPNRHPPLCAPPCPPPPPPPRAARRLSKPAQLVPPHLGNRDPSYFILAGLVFTVASELYLEVRARPGDTR